MHRNARVSVCGLCFWQFLLTDLVIYSSTHLLNTADSETDVEEDDFEEENIRLSREVKLLRHEAGQLQIEVTRLTEKVKTVTQINTNVEQVLTRTKPLTHSCTVSSYIHSLSH